MSENGNGEATTAKTTYLNIDDLHFERTAGGFLSMRFQEKEFPRVHLYRIFPLSLEQGYISVRDQEDNEIGIIESSDGMSSHDKTLVEDEIAGRYFTPVIKRIISLKEEFGYSYWEVETSAGVCRMTVQNRYNPVLRLEENRIIITDVDGCRFEMEDYTAVEPKHLRVIEGML